MYSFNKIIRDYTIGGIGQNLVYALISGAYLFYFTEAVGFSAATVGTILLVVRIVGLIIDPNVAVLIEKTNTRWGKYKPYLVTMPVVISLLLVALFFRPNLNGTIYLVYIYIITILFWIAYAFFDISYWSLVPSITKDSSKRVKLLTVCKSGILFAAFGLGIGRMPLVHLLGKGSYERGFLYLAIILAAIFTISGTILSRTVSKINEDEDIAITPRDRLTGKEIITALKGNDQLITVILAKLAISLPIALKSVLVIYFYKYQLGNDTLGSFASMLSLPLTLALISLCPRLLKIYSNRQVMTVFVVIQLVFSIFYILNTDISAFYIIIDGISNALMGVYSLIFTNMVADCVEYGEWKTSVRTESIIFSANTISSKLSTGLSGAIAGWLLTCIGYNPNANQSTSMLNSLHLILVLVPAIGLLLGIIILRKYILDKEMYQKIVSDFSQNNK